MAQPSPILRFAGKNQNGLTFAEQMAEKAAKDAGFASVAAQQANRMMRNQLEMKATQLGVSNQDAYALAGADLTNTQALQEAWNKVVAPPKKKEAAAANTKSAAATASATTTPEPTGPSKSDLAIQDLTDKIASLTSGFETQLTNQATEFDKIRKEQEQRMTGLQNMFIAQRQQQDRPTVAGVKTATGSAGDAMQVARRGVSGAFGRRGMRISSLNV